MNDLKINEQMKITWLGQGGFLFEAGGVRLVIDPYISDCVAKVDGFDRLQEFPVALEDLKPDFVLTTHDHRDHFDPEGMEWIRDMYSGCCYGGPERSYKHFLDLGIAAERVQLVEIGSSYKFGPFEVLAVYAKHSDPTACGYIISFNGKKVYLSGDSNFDEQLLDPAWSKTDLMLICINGKLGNMNDIEALDCVRFHRPAAAYPMHIEMFAQNTVEPDFFINGCRRLGINSRRLIIGETFCL